MATLAGTTVVIVGGTAGVGLGVAKASLLSLAQHVIVASSTKVRVDSATKSLQDLAKEKGLPGKVSGHVLNASSKTDVQEFMKSLGEVDHFVWSAGRVPPTQNPKEITADWVQGTMSQNLWAAIAGIQAAKIRSSITLTTGTRTPPGWGLLGTVSGAVKQLAQGLAVDMAPIRVNAIALGFVNSNLWDFMPDAQRKVMLVHVAEKLPVKHVADGDEVAEAYIFAMKCGYLTGQVISVDGGNGLV